MNVFCRKHKTFENVVGSLRDDPVLACGCVKQFTNTDSCIAKCKEDIERFLVLDSLECGISIDQARENLINLLLAYSYNVA